MAEQQPGAPTENPVRRGRSRDAEAAQAEETKAEQVQAGEGSEESEAQGMSFEELEPKPAPGAVNPVEADISPVHVFDPDVGDVDIRTKVDYEADEVADFDGEPVTSLQTANGGSGALLNVNGTNYILNRSQAGVLAGLAQSLQLRP